MSLSRNQDRFTQDNPQAVLSAVSWGCFSSMNYIVLLPRRRQACICVSDLRERGVNINAILFSWAVMLTILEPNHTYKNGDISISFGLSLHLHACPGHRKQIFKKNKKKNRQKWRVLKTQILCLHVKRGKWRFVWQSCHWGHFISIDRIPSLFSCILPVF